MLTKEIYRRLILNSGDIIKNRRIELGLTQEELGEKIGVQKSAIAKYENGTVENLKRSVIAKLAEVLQLSPLQIMGLEDESEGLKNFITAEEAVKFLLEQNVIMALNGVDITKLSEEEQIQMANEVLDLINMVSYKYKK